MRIRVAPIVNIIPILAMSVTLGVLVYSVQNPKESRLTPASTEAPTASFVTGYIIDSNTKLPVVGAKVVGNGNVGSSNSEGFFSVPVSSGTVEMTINMKGYTAEEKSFNLNQGETVEGRFELRKI